MNNCDMSPFCPAIALTIVLLPAAAQAQRGARPNIIYIMTDDHAATAIGAYGSRVDSTPHIDRLAREGALRRGPRTRRKRRHETSKERHVLPG